MKAIIDKKSTLKNKTKISISLDGKIFEKLEGSNLKNKSAFVSWLIEQHYGIISNGDE